MPLPANSQRRTANNQQPPAPLYRLLPAFTSFPPAERWYKNVRPVESTRRPRQDRNPILALRKIDARPAPRARPSHHRSRSPDLPRPLRQVQARRPRCQLHGLLPLRPPLQIRSSPSPGGEDLRRVEAWPAAIHHSSLRLHHSPLTPAPPACPSARRAASPEASRLPAWGVRQAARPRHRAENPHTRRAADTGVRGSPPPGASAT